MMTIKGDKRIHVRCRQCFDCKALKQQQWISRLCFEDAYNQYHPVFITPTYAEEPKSEKIIIQHWQKFIKRLRDRSFNIRYFVSLERGGKKGRLHLHAILWSDISFSNYKEQRLTYEKAWKHGFCLLRIMYGGKSGFNYASKYILKETLWYSYSRRPGLGSEGKSHYLERGVTEYLRTGRIIDRVRLRVLREEITIRAHSGWRKQLRTMLGIKVIPGTDYHYLEEPVKLEDYGEKKERLITKT